MHITPTKLLVKINLDRINEYLIDAFQAKPVWCTGYRFADYGLIYIKYRDLVKQGFSIPDVTDLEDLLHYEGEPLYGIPSTDMDIMLG